MPRRKRKIEVPDDTQSTDFQLGDTAADVERRRVEREQREQRERQEREEREERERQEREQLERQERERIQREIEERDRALREERERILREESEKDTETDTEAATVRSRKLHLSQILLSDSDEEALVEYIKNHPELYDKGHELFKNKGHKACLWERIAAQRHIKPEDARKWFETQRTRYGKLTAKKSGSGVTKQTPRQTWIENTFPFLDGHIRRKGVSKSSSFQTRPGEVLSSTPIQDVTRLSTDSEMDVTLQSEVSRAPRALASPSPSSRGGPTPTTDTSVMETFREMKAIMNTFLKPRDPEPVDKRRTFCDYLYSELKDLTDKEFDHFRRTAVNTLSNLPSEATPSVQESPPLSSVQAPETQYPASSKGNMYHHFKFSLPCSREPGRDFTTTTTRVTSHVHHTSRVKEGQVNHRELSSVIYTRDRGL